MGLLLDGKRPLFQQGLCVVRLQHTVSVGQGINVHPCGHAIGVTPLAAFFCFFFLAFLGASLADSAAGAAACATGFSAGAAPAAQTGAARIKVLNNSSMYFMVLLPFLVVEKIIHTSSGTYELYSSPVPNTDGQLSCYHHASFSLAYISRPLLKRGLSLSISVY